MITPPPLKPLLLGIILSLALPALAQSECLLPQLLLETPELLPVDRPVVRTIQQDQQGALWFGTENGAFVYDGSRVKTVPLPDDLPLTFIDYIGRWQEQTLLFSRDHLVLLQDDFQASSLAGITDPDKRWTRFDRGEQGPLLARLGWRDMHLHLRSQTIADRNETYLFREFSAQKLGNRLYLTGQPFQAVNLDSGELDVISPWSVISMTQFAGQLILGLHSTVQQTLPGLLALYEPGDAEPRLLPGFDQPIASSTTNTLGVLQMLVYQQQLHVLYRTTEGLWLLVLDSKLQPVVNQQLGPYPMTAKLFQGPGQSLWGISSNGELWQLCQQQLISQQLYSNNDPENTSHFSAFWDRQERLWVGLPDGGLLTARQQPDFLQHWHQHNSGLTSDKLRNFHWFGEQQLLVQTQDSDLLLLDRASGALQGQLNPVADSGGWRTPLVSSDQQLWLSGSHGVWRQDKVGEWQQLDTSASFAMQEHQQLIWVAQRPGIRLFSRQGELLQQFSLPHTVRAMQPFGDAMLVGLHERDPALLLLQPDGEGYRQTPIASSVQNPFAITPDPQGGFWVGGWGSGLVYLDADFQQQAQYRTSEGLPSNLIYGMAFDEQQRLWFSTDRGLAVTQPCRDAQQQPVAGCLNFLQVFDRSHGLSCGAFDAESLYRAPDHSLYFGGICGMVRVIPERYQPNPKPPELYLSALYLDGQRLAPQALQQPDGALRLRPDAEIALQLAARQLAPLAKVEYRLNQGRWLTADDDLELRMTGLQNGRHQLEFRGYSPTGLVSATPLQLDLYLPPPWWKHPLAWLFYLLALLLTITLCWLWRQRALKAKARWLEQEVARKTSEIQAVNQRMERVIANQKHFFAHVSHEFRTPLTLIMAPAQQLSRQLQGSSQQLVLHIQHSAERLNTLVEQLLTLARLDEDTDLPLVACEVNQQTETTLRLLKPLAAAKQQQLEARLLPEPLWLQMQPDSLPLIISNLVHNAIKYSPEGTIIELIWSRQGEQCCLQVRDQGPGIAAEHQHSIFAAFHRLVRADIPGAGLGLHAVQLCCQRHGGSIRLNPEYRQGVEFELCLPIQPGLTAPELSPDNTPPPGPALPSEATDFCVPDAVMGQRILLVEDEPEMAQYLLALLQPNFEVQHASDGQQALQLLNELPDLVISDVMMPELDGVALCHQLKQQESTRHIPVLLVSARSDPDSKQQGLLAQANDYIGKPFAPDELLCKVSNLLCTMQAQAQRVLQRIGLDEPLPVQESTDFSSRLLQAIEQNLSDEQLSVEQLASQFCMSGRHFSRKVQQECATSPGRLIHLVRLRHGRKQLQQSQLSISEIAFQCGMKPDYFSRQFKKEFGEAPSALRGQGGTAAG